MTKLMTAAVAAALIAGSSFSAFAADVTGSITSIDSGAGTIVLDNGKTYQVAADASTGGTAAAGQQSGAATPTVLSSFKAGDKVKITFEEKDGKLMASVVAPVTM